MMNRWAGELVYRFIDSKKPEWKPWLKGEGPNALPFNVHGFMHTLASARKVKYPQPTDKEGKSIPLERIAQKQGRKRIRENI